MNIVAMMEMLFAARDKAAPGSRLAATINWRISMCAKALMAKVLRDIPVCELSGRIIQLRDTI